MPLYRNFCGAVFITLVIISNLSVFVLLSINYLFDIQESSMFRRGQDHSFILKKNK